MKNILNDIYQNKHHEEILKEMAHNLYSEILNICKTAANYGRREIIIDLTELPTFRWITDDKVYQYLDEELGNLLKSKNMPMYHMSWILTAEEQKIPIITARELLEAGYKVDDLGKILKILKTAKARGEVADTLQAELIWIKQKFN